MTRYIALLRGVNVGKANRLPMAGFKATLEAMQCTQVKTLLNSGNAVFDSKARSCAKLAAAITAGLNEQFGITTPTIVVSAAQLQDIIRNNPLRPADDGHSRFLVAFSQDANMLKPLAAHSSLAAPGERFAVTDKAAYLDCPQGFMESRLAAKVLGKAGSAFTTRNWATVLKLGELCDTAKR
ncbi:MAG: DUF1697 domain-containing protein [Gammaproteobacteria bacterium]|nr:DUF1697 domain-containing protein [Gammaproteobacteria bacterium]